MAPQTFFHGLIALFYHEKKCIFVFETLTKSKFISRKFFFMKIIDLTIQTPFVNFWNIWKNTDRPAIFFLFYHLFYTHDVSPIFQSLQRILYLWCTYWDTSCLSVFSPNAGTTKSERCCNAQSTWCYFLYETTTKTFNQLNWFSQLDSCTC